MTKNDLLESIKVAFDAGNHEKVLEMVEDALPQYPDELMLIYFRLLSGWLHHQEFSLIMDDFFSIARTLNTARGIEVNLRRLLTEAVKTGASHYSVLSRLKNSGFMPKGILDIGACLGQWTHVALTVFPDTPTVMVDGNPEVASKLAADKERFGHNVRCETAVLGKKRDAPVKYYISGTGSSLFPERAEYGQKSKFINVETITLDELLEKYKNEEFSLIKIDTQGAEIEILEGFSGLEKAEAVILEGSIIEYNVGTPMFSDIVLYMNGRGFVIHDLFDFKRGGNGMLTQVDMLFIRKDSKILPQGSLGRWWGY